MSISIASAKDVDPIALPVNAGKNCISGKKDVGNHSHCRRDAGRNHQACRETAAEQRKNRSKIAHHVTAELFVLLMPIGEPLGVDQHVTAKEMFN